MRLRTILALGPHNVARVLLYRAGLATGLHPRLTIHANAPSGPFFSPPLLPAAPHLWPRKGWIRDEELVFGQSQPRLDGATDPPDWFASADGTARISSKGPWWKIPDFASGAGDIKAIWERSRFDWLLAMAQRAACGDDAELQRLNQWMANWCATNPPYMGCNWKCGQEASIRLLHAILAAVMLGQDSTPQRGLRDFVKVHLQRIAPTIGYAIGQTNNHGTSEAAALFVGGSFLGGIAGQRWSALGRKWLENRARHLIAKDGTFSQYSVTYHRVMLDTYAMAELWRKRHQLPAFSMSLTKRLTAATVWLVQMTDPESGDAPVIGANDGAHLIRLTDCGYRDFRPSVQLASTLFKNAAPYPTGPWDQQLFWLGIDRPAQTTAAPQSKSFDDGGFHVLRAGAAIAYLRYPRFRFRPSQADAMHCDLWVRGQNILRDAGTFSYNTSAADMTYFNGAFAHNTITFDNRDQMPRLGRFLFGNWLQAQDVELITDNSAAAAYQDRKGAYHARHLTLHSNCLVVRDTISGFQQNAILRWRLRPGAWELSGHAARSQSITLSVSATTPITRLVFVEGWESRYYSSKTPVPVLEIAVDRPGVLTTKVEF
ncbi:heparinase II/III-family protein [Yoonia sp.]|uniref:heparinase II/III family protein n=1 Tax=Yoonia sp. TaxID=2212373 RepID=UPI0025E565E1|nr:heparinase II/III-family protein [Yoonia sp.]